MAKKSKKDSADKNEGLKAVYKEVLQIRKTFLELIDKIDRQDIRFKKGS